MKKILLAITLLYTAMLSAVNYTDVIITPSENTLVSHSAAIGSKLPADFNSSIFDGSGNPTMDRLLIFMTLPSISNYTITEPQPHIVLTPKNPSNLSAGLDMSTQTSSYTLSTGNDVLFSYVKDGSRYVLDRLPFDPTIKALDEITLAKNETSKIFITGSTTNSLNAEYPERVKIVAPTYLKSIEQSLSDLFVQYIKSYIGQMGLDDFSFNPNCEGFFQFTGDIASHLHVYSDNLSMKVKGKRNDFLGTIVASTAVINLMGLESVEDYATEWAEGVTDSELTSMSQDDVQALDEQQIRALTKDRLLIIATKLSVAQCGYLTTGQILDLLGYTDIIQAFAASESEISTALYAIFQNPEKAQAVGNNLKDIQNKLFAQLSPIMSNPTSIILGDMDIMTAMGKIFSSFVEGSASPFAFKSNSQELNGMAFNVHIHSNGTNTITGGAPASFKNTGKEMAGLLSMANMSGNKDLADLVNDLAIMFEAVVRFSSAPFAVRPSAKMIAKDAIDDYEYTCTRLFFDDIWTDGTTRTNGLMQMPVVGDEIDAPSIDLGTPNGQVEFNGGRYKFHTPVSNKKNMFYVATMAICYREFKVTMPFINQQITYTGLGTSVGWGPQQNRSDYYRNVIIRDGTFSTYSAEAWKNPARGDYATDAVANGWYKHYTDLRLPYNTSILGGSFPDETYVYRCDAAAEAGVDPVYIYQADENSTPEFTALCIRKEVAAPSLSETFVTGQNTPVVVDNDKEQELLFTVNGTSTKWNYGHNSMMADNNGLLWLYVPGDCHVNYTYVRNYVTALCPFGEKKSGTTMLSMGGDVEAKSLYQDNVKFPMKNAYLLYAQLGYYTVQYAGVNLGGLYRTLSEEYQIETNKHHNFSPATINGPATVGKKIVTTDTTGVVFAEITNTDSYQIEYGQYMMLPARSNEWMLISPPFDVANVYILETTDERGNFSWTDAQWSEYYIRQGEADGDMAQELVTSVLPDVFSGRGSGVLRPLPDILNSINAKTKLTKLTHYDGSNFMTANYYLNEMIYDAAPNKWNKEDNINKYGNKWAPAPAQSTPDFLTITSEDPDCDFYDDDCDDITNVLPYRKQDGSLQEQQWVVMKHDSVYSMFFPGGNNRFYNYKYLILEGYGPQSIKGANAHLTFTHPNTSSSIYHNHPGDDYIALQGNTTFANDTITELSSAHPLFYSRRTQSGSYPTGSIVYDFVPVTKSTQTVLPTRVYMVSNNNSSVKATMPAIKHNTTDLNNIPTLADDAVRVWTDNGIYISAIISQHISVYTLDGRTLWSGEVSEGTTQFVPADRGMYVVQGETTAVKVVN